MYLSERHKLLRLAAFGCCAALLLLLLLGAARVVGLGHILNGIMQPPARVEQGALPGVAFARWQEPEPGELSFWVSPAAVFAHGYSNGTLQFETGAASPYTLAYELTATVEGRTAKIFRSPPVPPGHCINGAKLAVPLKKGTYQAACVAYAYEDGVLVARSEAQTVQVTVES